MNIIFHSELGNIKQQKHCEFFYKPKLLAGKIGLQSLIRKMEIYKLNIPLIERTLCHSLVETKIRGCWRHVRRQQRQFVVGINDRPNHGKASLSFVNADDLFTVT